MSCVGDVNHHPVDGRSSVDQVMVDWLLRHRKRLCVGAVVELVWSRRSSAAELSQGSLAAHIRTYQRVPSANRNGGVGSPADTPDSGANLLGYDEV